MGKMIIEKLARAVGVCIVSTTHCTHLKFAANFFFDIVLNIKQSEGDIILISFLSSKNVRSFPSISAINQMSKIQPNRKCFQYSISGNFRDDLIL